MAATKHNQLDHKHSLQGATPASKLCSSIPDNVMYSVDGGGISPLDFSKPMTLISHPTNFKPNSNPNPDPNPNLLKRLCKQCRNLNVGCQEMLQEMTRAQNRGVFNIVDRLVHDHHDKKEKEISDLMPVTAKPSRVLSSPLDFPKRNYLWFACFAHPRVNVIVQFVLVSHTHCQLQMYHQGIERCLAETTDPIPISAATDVALSFLVTLYENAQSALDVAITSVVPYDWINEKLPQLAVYTSS